MSSTYKYKRKPQKIRKIIQKTFEQLQLEKIQEDMDLLLQLEQLRLISQKLQKGEYINVVGRLGIEEKSALKQKNFSKLLNQLNEYIDLLYINSYHSRENNSIKKHKPKQLKSHPSIKLLSNNQQQVALEIMKQKQNQSNQQYQAGTMRQKEQQRALTKKKQQQKQKSIKQNQQDYSNKKQFLQTKKYFSFFHDLQFLKQIIIPYSQTNQTIQNSVNKIKNSVIDQPDRPNYSIGSKQIKYQYIQNQKDLDSISDIQIEYPQISFLGDSQNQQHIQQNEQSESIKSLSQQSRKPNSSLKFNPLSILESKSKIISQSQQNLSQSQKNVIKEQERKNKDEQQEGHGGGEQKQLLKEQQGSKNKVSQKNDENQTWSQKSVILQHLSKLQYQLSQSLKQQSFDYLAIDDEYLQMVIDELLQKDNQNLLLLL